jgi:hypothetical protein
MPSVLPIGDQTAVALLFIATFALLLIAVLGALLILDRFNPDLFERIEGFLFGPLDDDQQQLGGFSPLSAPEHDGPASPCKSANVARVRNGPTSTQGRSAAADHDNPRDCAPVNEALDRPAPA